MPLRAPSCLSLREVDRLGFRIIKRFQSFNLYERSENSSLDGKVRSWNTQVNFACQIKVLLSHDSEQHNSISIMGPLLNTQSRSTARHVLIWSKTCAHAHTHQRHTLTGLKLHQNWPCLHARTLARDAAAAR